MVHTFPHRALSILRFVAVSEEEHPPIRSLHGNTTMRWNYKKLMLIGLSALLTAQAAHPQNPDENGTSAGYTPVLSGTFAYVQNANAGVTSLEPEIETVLLVPFSSHVLLESRAEFTGFFSRQFQTSGPYVGKGFKNVDYAP